MRMPVAGIPGLSTTSHILCYPNTMPRRENPFADHRRPFVTNVNGNGSTEPCKRQSSIVYPQTIEDKVLYTYERQRVVDLCNTYAYWLDSTMVDLQVAREWANLFTVDCIASYPFGVHEGREGLAEFGMGTEARFKRMLHSNTNIMVVFESNDIAHVRYTCFALHGYDKDDLSKHFAEGGYYYSTFKRDTDGEHDCWRIHRLSLDINWVMGDSKGANDAHEPLKSLEEGFTY